MVRSCMCYTLIFPAILMSAQRRLKFATESGPVDANPAAFFHNELLVFAASIRFQNTAHQLKSDQTVHSQVSRLDEHLIAADGQHSRHPAALHCVESILICVDEYQAQRPLLDLPVQLQFASFFLLEQHMHPKSFDLVGHPLIQPLTLHFRPE